MQLRSGRLVTSSSHNLTMDPPQLDALTRQLAQLVASQQRLQTQVTASQQQLQTQVATIQTEIAAAREETRDLVARMSTFEQTPHLTEVENSDASSNRHHRRPQGVRQHVRHNRRDGHHVREREREHHRLDTQSPRRHDERFFRNINWMPQPLMAV